MRGSRGMQEGTIRSMEQQGMGRRQQLLGMAGGTSRQVVVVRTVAGIDVTTVLLCRVS